MMTSDFEEYMQDIVQGMESLMSILNKWDQEDNADESRYFEYIEVLENKVQFIFESYRPSKYALSKDRYDFHFESYEEALMFADTVMKLTNIFIGYWIVEPHVHDVEDFQYVARIYLDSKERELDYKIEKIIN